MSAKYSLVAVKYVYGYEGILASIESGAGGISPIWQCTSHTPGLSGRNAIARYPPAGSSATSRLGGLLKLKVFGLCCMSYSPVL